HEGAYQKVLWTTRHHYRGDVVEIHPTGFPPFRLTPTHPVWAFPRPTRRKGGRDRWPHILSALKEGIEPRWVRAGELQAGWVLASPVLQEKEDRATLTAEGFGLIPVDEAFLTLCGYYLAEGTLSGKGGKPYQQFFYFHEREDAYVEKLRVILTDLGVRPGFQRRRHTAEVVTHSLALGTLLEGLFGRGAATKHLPGWMVQLPHEKQRALIRALWEGDGYRGCVRGYGRATYSTSSWALALQVHQILLRLGIAAFLHHRDQRGRRRNWVISVTSEPGLARLDHLLGLRAAPAPDGSRMGQVVLDHRAFYTGVRAVRRLPHAGHVHNLEVEGAHSFSVPGATLHNCEVNGPGEARGADVGVAGGRGIGLIFRQGRVVRKVPEAEIVDALWEEVQAFLADQEALARQAVQDPD
ncbi:MAG: flavodoxin-dependent (E)-4-hydroxy-3-methylbut-2-enyl-diphosphate synthase, partial [Candidatus Rokubacteria bacterium]|nr:flavodoxin-dependent (E)-4-hydroxy-3-methylbut-2-enyl-diphosphate synthase [Candidatus Rokubacteria bacterium]